MVMADGAGITIQQRADRGAGEDIRREADHRHQPDRAAGDGEWQSHFVHHRKVDAAHSIDAEAGRGEQDHERSEEHTSELQSLMPISEAVLCLKKKRAKLLTTLESMI